MSAFLAAIMVEKLFSLLSSFVEYQVAGVYFASPDDFSENIIYIDTLGRNLSKNLLSDINYDFFRKIEEHKFNLEKDSLMDIFKKKGKKSKSKQAPKK